MAFDHVVFPLLIDTGGSIPEFNTTIIPSGSLSESRNGNWQDARVTFNAALGVRSTEDLKKLIEQHESDYPCNLFDGNEHSYLEIGGFVDDQGYGLTLMGLGSLLGLWTLLTPRSVLGSLCTDEMAMELAGRGMITIMATAKKS